MTRRLHPDDGDLSLYADWAADPATAIEVEAHLAVCGRCREFVAAQRRGLAVLALASEPPEVLFEQIRERRQRGERAILPGGGPAPSELEDVPEVVGRDVNGAATEEEDSGRSGTEPPSDSGSARQLE